MSEHIPLHLLEPHPLALRCASFCAGTEREAAEAALAASVRECGVKVPLVVTPKLSTAPDYWVLDGCARLEAARAAGLDSVPVLKREFNGDENAMGEEIFRLNTVRKPFTSSQRVMLWVDIHLGAVLESYAPKGGRPKKTASNEAVFSVADTAERLGVSRNDVAAAAELARCVNSSMVPCTVNGERSVRDATPEEAGRLDAVMASVREGRTPLRRWLAAFEGMANSMQNAECTMHNEEVGGREADGRPRVNWARFAPRTATSLRTLFAGWRAMPPELRAPSLDALSQAVDEAPDDVLDMLRAKLAEREAARKGGAE